MFKGELLVSGGKKTLPTYYLSGNPQNKRGTVFQPQRFRCIVLLEVLQYAMELISSGNIAGNSSETSTRLVCLMDMLHVYVGSCLNTVTVYNEG